MIDVRASSIIKGRTRADAAILYIGPDSGTCRARFDALTRLGHDCVLVDPFEALPTSRWSRMWSFKTGGLGCSGLVDHFIRSAVGKRRFDLAYVDSGELLGARSIRNLRRFAPVVVNYNPDNPYADRDGWRWRAFRNAIPEYDQLFVPRLENVSEARAAGARMVHRVWFAADDRLRDPAGLPEDAETAPYRSKISFVGTWMPERGALLASLLEHGLPLRIFGPRWNRAPEWRQLAPFTLLGELSSRAYEAAVAAADISIALLSKGNRDLHTTRSVEIPALGSLLCGERTGEHEALYVDGSEAVLWSSGAECVDVCRALLADPGRRAHIAAAGRRRALVNDRFNRPLMKHMIALAFSGHPQVDIATRGDVT